jgi:hypothetical protein
VTLRKAVLDGSEPGTRTCPAGHRLGYWWMPRMGCAGCRFEDLGDRLAARMADDVPDVALSSIRAAIDVATTMTRERLALLELAEAGLEWLRDGRSTSPLIARRLIVDLTRRGAAGLQLPRCERCGRTRPLAQRGLGGRVCCSCFQALGSQACAGCNRVARVRFRDEAGRPWCTSCRSKDPAVWKRCMGCGRMAPADKVTADGALCRSCYKVPARPCGFCATSFASRAC